MRDKYSGTYLIDGDKIEKLNTKTDQTISPLVYPSWHPSGKYVAFSVNQTSQSFMPTTKPGGGLRQPIRRSCIRYGKA